MRGIWIACVCAAGCDLYFGPGDRDASPAPPPDAAIVAGPDASPIVPPDPPATCSTTVVYVESVAGDARAPFLIASIRDAFAFYHVPIATTQMGPGVAIELSPTQPDTVSSMPPCLAEVGAMAIVQDDRSRSNEEIVAAAVRALGAFTALPLVVDAGDCMNDAGAPPGCVLGRASTVALDECGGFSGAVDEAQWVADRLGCPGVGG